MEARTGQRRGKCRGLAVIERDEGSRKLKVTWYYSILADWVYFRLKRSITVHRSSLCRVPTLKHKISFMLLRVSTRNQFKLQLPRLNCFRVQVIPTWPTTKRRHQTLAARSARGEMTNLTIEEADRIRDEIWAVVNICMSSCHFTGFLDSN